MPDDTINLVKLCVGIDSVEHLVEWRRNRAALAQSKGEEDASSHTTRMWPKQEKSLLNGGSLYWVIKGNIQIRQRLLRLDEAIGHDGIRRCKIVLEPLLIRTNLAPRRPFQGWRYLKPEDAPADLPQARGTDDSLPKELELALSEIGLR